MVCMTLGTFMPGMYPVGFNESPGQAWTNIASSSLLFTGSKSSVIETVSLLIIFSLQLFFLLPFNVKVSVYNYSVGRHSVLSGANNSLLLVPLASANSSSSSPSSSFSSSSSSSETFSSTRRAFESRKWLLLQYTLTIKLSPLS